MKSLAEKLLEQGFVKIDKPKNKLKENQLEINKCEQCCEGEIIYNYYKKGNQFQTLCICSNSNCHNQSELNNECSI